MNNKITKITMEQFDAAPVGQKFWESFGSSYQFFNLVKNSNGLLDGTTNHYNYDTNSWETRVVSDGEPLDFISEIEFQIVK